MTIENIEDSVPLWWQWGAHVPSTMICLQPMCKILPWNNCCSLGIFLLKGNLTQCVFTPNVHIAKLAGSNEHALLIFFGLRFVSFNLVIQLLRVFRFSAFAFQYLEFGSFSLDWLWELYQCEDEIIGSVWVLYLSSCLDAKQNKPTKVNSSHPPFILHCTALPKLLPIGLSTRSLLGVCLLYSLNVTLKDKRFICLNRKPVCCV